MEGNFWSVKANVLLTTFTSKKNQFESFKTHPGTNAAISFLRNQKKKTSFNPTSLSTFPVLSCLSAVQGSSSHSCPEFFQLLLSSILPGLKEIITCSVTSLEVLDNLSRLHKYPTVNFPEIPSNYPRSAWNLFPARTLTDDFC